MFRTARTFLDDGTGRESRTTVFKNINGSWVQTCFRQNEYLGTPGSSLALSATIIPEEAENGVSLKIIFM